MKCWLWSSLLFIAITISLASIQLRVIVLAFNRPDQLALTLQSLGRAFFPQGTPLAIHIDGPLSNLTNLSLQVSLDFYWPYGTKSVYVSPLNKGTVGQWRDAWTPTSNGEFALFIEDDVEISPAAPLILLDLIRKHKDDQSIYGIALQKAQWVMGAYQPSKWRRLDLAHQSHHPQYTSTFKYFATGTWGQLMFPKPWRAFLKSKPSDETVEGLLSDHWERERMGRNLFSPAFNRFALARQLYNLYMNYPNGTALAISRQPPGVNVKTVKYNERLLKESEALKFYPTLSPPIVKNHCWDSLPVSPMGQLRESGFVVIEGPRCCLEGRWRLPIASPDNGHHLYPEFKQLDSFIGCWESDPVAFLKQFLDSPFNIQFISEDSNALIGWLRVSRDSTQRCKQVIVPLGIYNPRLRNILSDGVRCAALLCPYRQGKYPASYRKQS